MSWKLKDRAKSLSKGRNYGASKHAAFRVERLKKEGRLFTVSDIQEALPSLLERGFIDSWHVDEFDPEIAWPDSVGESLKLIASAPLGTEQPRAFFILNEQKSRLKEVLIVRGKNESGVRGYDPRPDEKREFFKESFTEVMVSYKFKASTNRFVASSEADVSHLAIRSRRY